MSTQPSSVLSNFIRKWQIDIDTGRDAQGQSTTITVSSSEFGNYALRATFDCAQFGYRAFWYGDIVIYNLDAAAIDKILNEGMTVTVSAGYENGNYGQIFVGKIMQSFVERENVTDYKVILHCVAGRPEIINNFITYAIDGKQTAEDVLQRIINQAPTKLSLDYVKGTLSSTDLPRGFVCASDAGTFLDMIAKDSKMLWWFDGDKVSVSDFGVPDPEAIIISPPALQGETAPAPGTLIGTPQQTQFGCALRVLLDPRFRVKTRPVLIKLDMSSMIFIKRLIGQPPNFLDASGVYVIAGVRHYGDTRGNEWYSEATCYSMVRDKLGVLTGSHDTSTWTPEQSLDQSL